MLVKKTVNRHFAAQALLTIAAFAVYGKTLSFELLGNWDDATYITNNFMVRGLTLRNLQAAFTSVVLGNYAPLHMVSYMIDFEFWGGSPFGYHLSNILLHLANGILMYVILQRMSWGKWHSLAASMLFIVHPVQVESVAWASERKNLLSLFFFFLAWNYYISFRTNSVHKQRYYLCSLIAFLFAMMSKSVSVVFPLIILAYDSHFHSNETIRRWRYSLPFFALSAVFSIMTMLTQSIEMGGGRTGYHGGGPLATFFTMLPVFLRYLMMLVWPSDLSPIYNPTVRETPDSVVVLSAIVVATIITAGYIFYRQRNECFFWIAFFFAALLPVSQIVPLVTLMNDRYLYFPLVAASCLAIIAISRICIKLKLAKIEPAIFTVVIIAFAYSSFIATAPWKDSISLWENATLKTPDTTGTWTGLGEAYQKAGNNDAALNAYIKALSIESFNPVVMNNIAIIYADKGELLKSRSYLIRLVKANPRDVNAQINLGNNYVLSGRYDLAEATYLKALNIEPDNGNTLILLGNVYLNTKHLTEAENLYRRSLEVAGETADLQYNWSALESLRGDYQAALKRLERALQLGYRNLNFIMKDPAMKPLMSHSDFHKLLETHFSKKAPK